MIYYIGSKWIGSGILILAFFLPARWRHGRSLPRIRDSRGYSAPRADSSIRSTQSLSESPQSIQVLGDSLLDEQRAQDIGDASKNVNNASQANSFGVEGARKSYKLRGFQVPCFPVNGLRLETPHDIASFRRVEIVKGPAAILFGAIEPGGAINPASRKPQSETRQRVDVAVGSFNNHYGQVDLTDSINEDRTPLYRLYASKTIRKPSRTIRGSTGPSAAAL